MQLSVHSNQHAAAAGKRTWVGKKIVAADPRFTRPELHWIQNHPRIETRAALREMTHRDWTRARATALQYPHTESAATCPAATHCISRRVCHLQNKQSQFKTKSVCNLPPQISNTNQQIGHRRALAFRILQYRRLGRRQRPATNSATRVPRKH
jgi:hypothetical protein